MKREAAAEKTLAIFRTIFGKIENLNEQTSSDDIDKWDSLNHVILIQELEKAFEMKFNLFDIIEIKDVGGLVNYIYSQSNE